MKSIDPFAMSSFFTLPNGDYDICKLCAAKIATRKNGSTHGNMERHLKFKHPDSQSLHKYMNSNINYLKKIRHQCIPGTLYTVIESSLQPTMYGDILIVSLGNSENFDITKTFLPSNIVAKLKDFYKNDGGELNNQSILGAVFKYVGEVEMENGHSSSKLEWFQQDMGVKNAANIPGCKECCKHWFQTLNILDNYP